MVKDCLPVTITNQTIIITFIPEEGLLLLLVLLLLVLKSFGYQQTQTRTRVAILIFFFQINTI